MKLSAFPIALLVAFSSVAAAAPVCKVKQGKPMLYRLDLTVPATFCQGGNGSQDPSCDEFPKESNLQLHGLWPNYRNGGYPSGNCGAGGCKSQSAAQGKFCQYPKPPGLYMSATWNEHSGYMAGTEKCLERHEWVKHGTCSGMSAVAYFDWALTTTASIAERLALPADTDISREQFNQLVREKTPELDGAIRLTCRGEALSGLYVLLEWGDSPGKPPGKPIPTGQGGNHFGNCKQTFYVPTRPN